MSLNLSQTVVHVSHGRRPYWTKHANILVGPAVVGSKTLTGYAAPASAIRLAAHVLLAIRRSPGRSIMRPYG